MKTLSELEAMSDAELRIMLAELDGWKRHDKHEDGFGAGQRLTTGWNNPGGIWFRKLPDFTADLNAVHQVEKTLTLDQSTRYMSDLWPRGYAPFQAVSAKARQRTIALILTLQQP